MPDQTDTKETQPSLTHGLRTANPSPAPQWVRVLVVAGIIALLVLSGLLWWSQRQVAQLRKDLDSKQNSTRIQEENKALVEKVGTLIALPNNETPTIATVNDLDKLSSQPFFDNAELGDKVLIYAKAKKAVLYRPSQNKIIELAPLSDYGNIPASTNENAAPVAPPINTSQ